MILSNSETQSVCCFQCRYFAGPVLQQNPNRENYLNIVVIPYHRVLLGAQIDGGTVVVRPFTSPSDPHLFI